MVPPNDFLQIGGRSGSLMQPVRSKDIHIPEPCHADWDAMRPEERGKFCFDCRKKVHDLSAMTKGEARDFLRDNACNDICVSYEHDQDGNLMFEAPAPPPAPVVPLSRLRHPRKLAATVAGVGMAAALAACAPHSDNPIVKYETEPVFQTQTEVIPHGEASEATPVPPPTTVDEPCDPQEPTEPALELRPRKKGKRIRRTAGKPMPTLRIKGDVAAVDL